MLFHINNATWLRARRWPMGCVHRKNPYRRSCGALSARRWKRCHQCWRKGVAPDCSVGVCVCVCLRHANWLHDSSLLCCRLVLKMLKIEGALLYGPQLAFLARGSPSRVFSCPRASVCVCCTDTQGEKCHTLCAGISQMRMQLNWENEFDGL